MSSVGYVLGVTRSILRFPCTRCMCCMWCMRACVDDVGMAWHGMLTSSVIGNYVTGGACMEIPVNHHQREGQGIDRVHIPVIWSWDSI